MTPERFATIQRHAMSGRNPSREMVRELITYVNELNWELARANAHVPQTLEINKPLPSPFGGND